MKTYIKLSACGKSATIINKGKPSKQCTGSAKFVAKTAQRWAQQYGIVILP